MTPSTSGRAVWGVGLLVYLVVGLGFVVFFWAPWIPFLGAVVLLACVSTTGAQPSDDPVVMRAAVAETAIGAFLTTFLFTKSAWMDYVGGTILTVGIVLPIGVIIYRVARPRLGTIESRTASMD